jgi:hypothetical protein
LFVTVGEERHNESHHRGELVADEATNCAATGREYREGSLIEREHLRLSPWCFSYLVPEIETFDVELNAGPSHVTRNAFHDELVLGDRLLAGVAGFAIAGTAPDSRYAVVRKTTVVELALNEETKRHWVHGWRSG